MRTSASPGEMQQAGPPEAQDPSPEEVPRLTLHQVQHQTQPFPTGVPVAYSMRPTLPSPSAAHCTWNWPSPNTDRVRHALPAAASFPPGRQACLPERLHAAEG